MPFSSIYFYLHHLATDVHSCAILHVSKFNFKDRAKVPGSTGGSADIRISPPSYAAHTVHLIRQGVIAHQRADALPRRI